MKNLIRKVLCAYIMFPTIIFAQDNFIKLSINDMCITSGIIQENLSVLKVKGNARAVAYNDEGNYAKVNFRYLGHSEKESPLASGEMRRQIALKLRGQDTCNVIYVAWHIEPTQQIAISTKINPNMSQHKQCGANGYKNLNTKKLYAPSLINLNEWHSLEASINSNILSVYADNKLVWSGIVPKEALNLQGSSGIRTDNADFDIEYFIHKNSKIPGMLTKSFASYLCNKD